MPFSLVQKTLQKQTPATIQLMKMIQMNGMELQNYLENMVQENPVLDMDSLPVYDKGFYSQRRNSLKEKASGQQIEFVDHDEGMTNSLYEDVSIQLDSLKIDDDNQPEKWYTIKRCILNSSRQGV